MQRKGENFDIDPKEIINPNGRENISVNEKIRQVVLKPCNNLSVTAKKFINLLFYCWTPAVW